MERTGIQYSTYVQILKEELVPAMGCTEPIALAYCAAKAREVLGCLPERCVVEASGNIVKNVKSVIVPNTGGLEGHRSRGGGRHCSRGCLQDSGSHRGGDGGAEGTDQGVSTDRAEICEEPLETDEILDMAVTVSGGGSCVKVRIAGYHTNIVLIEKDGEVLYKVGAVAAREAQMADRSLLNVEDIYDFAKTVDLEDVRDVIGRQIAYNQRDLGGRPSERLGRQYRQCPVEGLR